MMEVRQKGRHCAERWCHLPLKCDTGTAQQFLFVSSIKIIPVHNKNLVETLKALSVSFMN